MAFSPESAIKTNGARDGEPIRVMVVDDSVIIRGFLTRILETENDISVVASVGNGKLALVEMPVMDGLTALPLLLKASRTVKVIMASTLTKKNAEVSIKAMQLGAADYIPKPTSNADMGGASDFKREIVAKVMSLGQARRRQVGGPSAGAKPVAVKKPLFNKPVMLRDPGKSKPDILAIGSSTGGPQALFAFLKGIPLNPGLPVVITQHMPATFTSILAEHIAKTTGWPCSEGEDGIPLTGGRVFLAPGGYHMVIEARGVEKIIRLNQDPPENFCRPAVDPMFRSVAAAFGPRAIGVILTGMGSDGAKGGKVMVDAGATIAVQDEETSVVWGMPGSAATSGICSAVLPITELSQYVDKILNRPF